MYKNAIKRLIDIIISIIGLLIIIPILCVIAVILWFVNNGHPFFYQERPGKNERIFRLYKFKTMNDRCDAEGKILPDAERLTRIGLMIRSFSLDELPQLWNVFKGDMSLIGPRPLLPKYLALYNECQARRHEVRPGITGWAQVNGRNAISWQEKFEMDVWYVDNVSFKTDLKILLLTIKKVLLRKDINASESATMEAFTGNN